MINKVLPDGSAVTCFPLAPAQQLLYFLSIKFGDLSTNSPVLNIGSGFFFQDEIDDDAMTAAFLEAIQRCDTMRLRFIQDEEYQVLQYIVEDAEIAVEIEDYRDIPREEADALLKAHAKEPVPMFNVPLQAVKIVHLADGYNGIYARFNHLSKDGFSAKVFLGDVMAIYLHKTTGAPYPKPMRSYFDALKKEFAYKGSAQHKADQEYWAKSMTPEPIFTEYLINNRLHEQRIANGNPNQRYATANSGSPVSKRKIYHFDTADSFRLMDFCKENGISFSCLLLMATRTALSVLNENEEDVTFRFMVNRRGTLLEKKSGGTRMHFFSFRSIIKPEMRYVEAVRALEKIQNEIFVHSNISTLESMKIRHEIMGSGLEETYESTSFSYHPMMKMPCASEEIRATSYGVWYNNDFSMQDLYQTVMHRSSDGGLEFIYEYRITVENVLEAIERFYDKVSRALMIGLENPEIKVGDLLTQIAN